RGARAVGVVKGGPVRKGGEEPPPEPKEGEEGEGRRGHPPAEPRGERKREEAWHDLRIERRGLAGEPCEEGNVRPRQRDAGRLEGHIDLDVLEEALHAGRRRLAHQLRRSTACSVSPSCTTSPSWFTSSRSTVTR